MGQPNSLCLREGIFQIQILKPLIAEGLIVLPGELPLHEGTLVLEGGIVGIDGTLGFHDDGLMYLAILALHDQEVRGVHAT